MTCGALAVRMGAVFVEVHVTDPVQPVFDHPVARMMAASPAGLAWVAVSDVIA